jgi:hypothetical protein
VTTSEHPAAGSMALASAPFVGARAKVRENAASVRSRRGGRAKYVPAPIITVCRPADERQIPESGAVTPFGIVGRIGGDRQRRSRATGVVNSDARTPIRSRDPRRVGPTDSCASRIITNASLTFGGRKQPSPHPTVNYEMRAFYITGSADSWPVDCARALWTTLVTLRVTGG